MARWAGVGSFRVLLLLSLWRSTAHAQLGAPPSDTQPNSPAAANTADPSARRGFEPYSAPAGCPGYGEFLARVAAWLGKEPRAIEPRLAEFDIAIRPSSGAWVGTVRSAIGEGTPTRELTLPDCPSLAQQLALATAQAMNPELARNAPVVSAQPPLRSLPVAPRGQPYGTPPPYAGLPYPGVAPRAAAAERPLRWIPSLGGDFVLANGFAPYANVGGALRAGLTREGFGAWSPAAWVSLTYLLPNRSRLYGPGLDVEVSIDWLGVVLGGCPLGVGTEDGWSFRPCAILELGRSQASVSGVQNANAVSDFWSAFGAMARLGRRVGERFGLEADLALVAPFTRWEYRLSLLNQSVHIHRTPALAARLGLGLSWSFP